MAEVITLIAPVTFPSSTVLRLERIIIDLEAKSVMIQWLDNAGRGFSAVYPTPPPPGQQQPAGQALIATLNTANLSTLSLVKLLLQRLQTDGHIAAGTIGGVPA